MINEILLQKLIKLATDAGDIIMSHYSDKVEVERKTDNSPVTKADTEANEYIVNGLTKLTPDIPYIAEESDNSKVAGNLPKFWLVDPLDGTKSFIRRTGEFTVNIGLIDNSHPVFGVVYVPAKDELYYTGVDGMAYCVKGRDGKAEQITCRTIPDEGAYVVASHSHRTAETDDFIDKLPKVAKIVPAASSMKFCLLAAGHADIYPRFGPTMEWDTAAGHAVLIAAGGVVKTPEGKYFLYGKNDYKNGYFIAYGTTEKCGI